MFNNLLENFSRSSANPDKLSLTVKGAIIGIIPMFILVGQILGVEVARAEIVEIAQVFGTFVFTAITLIGLVRKVVYKFIR